MTGVGFALSPSSFIWKSTVTFKRNVPPKLILPPRTPSRRLRLPDGDSTENSF